ncbi:hypothetical protein RAC89_08525 [Paenibacillus sp. GD4]|uniref:hypothetical protein n=1 Tax=Paenibacillus sp. GD4 TaxID=3068890 RepID=UPI002796E041|nr:hypothetical protein [Paenibacillus sp. GD4]MDQ1910544.1 hypothetical protein [Paenibacillus sp. GD4]
MRTVYSAAEIARKLALPESTAHRRIQLAIDLGFIQAEKQGGRYKYSETDLKVVEILDACYGMVPSERKLIDLLSNKNITNTPRDGLAKLISVIVGITNEMLIQYASVSDALKKAEEMNWDLSRKLSNVQDKLDALWLKIDRFESRIGR